MQGRLYSPAIIDTRLLRLNLCRHARLKAAIFGCAGILLASADCEAGKARFGSVRLVTLTAELSPGQKSTLLHQPNHHVPLFRIEWHLFSLLTPEGQGSKSVVVPSEPASVRNSACTAARAEGSDFEPNQHLQAVLA
jgi:hypothetical protein